MLPDNLYITGEYTHSRSRDWHIRQCHNLLVLAHRMHLVPKMIGIHGSAPVIWVARSSHDLRHEWLGHLYEFSNYDGHGGHRYEASFDTTEFGFPLKHEVCGGWIIDIGGADIKVLREESDFCSDDYFYKVCADLSALASLLGLTVVQLGTIGNQPTIWVSKSQYDLPDQWLGSIFEQKSLVDPEKKLFVSTFVPDCPDIPAVHCGFMNWNLLV